MGLGERVNRVLLAALAPLTMLAQPFDPKLPVGIPEVAGPVVEAATMRWVDAVSGTGAPAAPGKRYTAHYTGWLRDGTKFDSSVDRKEPFVFVQGRRQVIAGWEMGFEGMKAGGKRRLYIPYQLAYGEAGSGTTIPPKAELIFDVELLAVDDAPQLLPAADLLLPFSDLERKVVALAEAVPEEKYSWRPGPGVRSFGEVFLHIAAGAQLLMRFAEGFPGPEELKKLIGETIAKEKPPVAKEQVVARLRESFAGARKTLEAQRAGLLARDTTFFGRPTTRRGVYISLNTHTAEHLGQAIAYARMNGIAPPW